MSHLRLTPANEPRVLLEDDTDHLRRMGMLAVWEAPSEADIAVLLDLVDDLPERQRRILTRHYGLDGSRGRSLRKVAAELRMSPTHARRLERRALSALAEGWPEPEVSL